jgi:hypothetical protein
LSIAYIPQNEFNENELGFLLENPEVQFGQIARTFDDLVGAEGGKIHQMTALDIEVYEEQRRRLLVEQRPTLDIKEIDPTPIIGNEAVDSLHHLRVDLEAQAGEELVTGSGFDFEHQGRSVILGVPLDFHSWILLILDAYIEEVVG